MKAEQQKMLAGEFYDPMDAELVAARARARNLCQALNGTPEAEQETRRNILQELFGKGGESVWMQPPFFCDYGSNIELGERVFFNFNCVVLDVCTVQIGSFTLFGPAVQVYTPMFATTRGKRQMVLGLRRSPKSQGTERRCAKPCRTVAVPARQTAKQPPLLEAQSTPAVSCCLWEGWVLRQKSRP